jgi:hypothetical protein
LLLPYIAKKEERKPFFFFFSFPIMPQLYFNIKDTFGWAHIVLFYPFFCKVSFKKLSTFLSLLFLFSFSYTKQYIKYTLFFFSFSFRILSLTYFSPHFLLITKHTINNDLLCE